jgi:hypothetical protein
VACVAACTLVRLELADPGADRARGRGNRAPARRERAEVAKSAPHRPPEHCRRRAAAPGVAPPTHVVGHVPPAGQSVSSTQLRRRVRARAGTLGDAQDRVRRVGRAEERDDVRAGDARIGLGSKIGGSLRPSGVYEARKTGSGT